MTYKFNRPKLPFFILNNPYKTKMFNKIPKVTPIHRKFLG